MSFADAVSQVDQIVQWEQQLGSGAPFSAASAASATGASGTSAAAGGSTDPTSGLASTSGPAATSSTAATFADALAQAQTSEQSSLLDPTSDTGSTDPSAAGTSDLLSGGDSQLLSLLSSLASGSAATTAATTTGATSGPDGGTASSPADPRVQAMLQAVNSMLGDPYVYGGGHASWGPQSGYDCSGFVSAVLHAGGYLSSPQDTTTLPSAPGIASGPGQYVTIYDRDEPGQEGHVIIDIAGQFYESGGEHGSWGGGGGVEEIATPPASYLATFNLVLHPEGL